jgi:predicted MPP superfamily phosphohydrolase
MTLTKIVGSGLIDVFCTCSIIGIYPRFIEPKLLAITNLSLPVASPKLDGFKIVQLSDLHFHKKVSSRFLKRISAKIKKIKPDLIVFTGDFICYSRLEDKERLFQFLNSFEAPYGCFCTFGNHDYASYVSRNSQGDYDVLQPANPVTGLMRGLRTIFEKSKPMRTGHVLPKARVVSLHQELNQLLDKTPFRLLENACHTLPIGLNIVGLGDYALNRFTPDLAFEGYNKNFPGLILSHNPDTAPLLVNYPGELILSGHSHGEQIHFPGPKFLRNISQRLTRLENPHLARGKKQLQNKTLYVNRGLGCHKAIRLFSIPEITVITLRSAK